MDETMDPSAPAPAPENLPAQDRIGPIGAFIGVVSSPISTFQRIAKVRWLWVVPLILLLASTAGQLLCYYTQADIGTVMREQMKHARTFSSDQTAAQEQQVEKLEQMAQKSKISVALLMSASPIVMVVVWFFVAALLYWVSFMAMGDQLGYVGALQAVGWCSVPAILKNLIGIGVVFLKDPSYTPVQNIVMSNPAAFLSPGDVPSWLYALLSFVDLFLIWKLALYFAAFPALAKATKAHTAIVVFAWLAVGMTLAVAAAAFFMA